MSAAQEAAQALASGAPLLSRSSSMHASPPNAGPTPKSANVNASMRALAAMREPESESVAHKAFEAPTPLTEEPEVVAAAEADAPVERVTGADVPTPVSIPPLFSSSSCIALTLLLSFHYATNLEALAFPDTPLIAKVAKRALYRSN